MKPYKTLLFLLCILLICFLVKWGIETRENAPLYTDSPTKEADSARQKLFSFFTPDTAWYFEEDLSHISGGSIVYDTLLEDHPLSALYRLLLSQKDSSLRQDILMAFSEDGESLERPLIRILLYTSEYGTNSPYQLLPSFRNYMQKAFGGKGIGLVPILSSGKGPLVVQKSSVWKAIRMQDQKRQGNYGICGGYLTAPPIWRVNPSLQKTNYGTIKIAAPSSAWGDRIEMLVHEEISTQDIHWILAQGKIFQDTNPTLKSSFGLSFLSYAWPIDEQKLELKIRLNRNSQVYALSLNSETGVCVDEIPYKGNGSIFSSQHRRFLAENYRMLGVKFIIYALNDHIPVSPTLTPADSSRPQAYAFYEQQLLREITYLHTLSPMTPLLIIGVSDRQHPHAQYLRQIQMRVAFSTACAFWDPSPSKKQQAIQTPKEAEAGGRLYKSLIQDLERYAAMERRKL